LVEEPPDDRVIRNAALAGVAQMLMDCQSILDGYGMSLESAHVDMTLNMLRNQIPIPEPSMDKLMKRFGFI
jgi:hypothetical protein